jgi:hypothetical protein
MSVEAKTGDGMNPVTQRLVGAGVFLVVLVATYWLLVQLGKFLNEGAYTIVVSEMPKRLYCQPFKQKETQVAEAIELKKLKAEPVMYQELNKAFYNQSQGKGEVIGQTNLVCFEKLGSSQTVSADTYFYRSVK